MHTCDALNINAVRDPDGIAIVDGDHSLTWEGLRQRTAVLAAALNRLGLEPGDRIGLLMGNCGRYIEATYAIQWLGGIAVPLNTRWTEEEIAFACSDCGIKAVFTDLDNAEKLSGVINNTEHTLSVIRVFISETSFVSIAYDDLIADGEAIPLRKSTEDPAASIFYTGGTTGRSKGVVLSHNNHVSHSIAMLAETRIGTDCRFLHAAPMFHIADALFFHLVSLCGGQHIVLRSFNPEDFAGQVAGHGITDTILVPTMIQMIFSHGTASGAFSHLGRLFYGASPMPGSLLERLVIEYPDLALCQLYGQTEASPVLTLLPPEWHGMDDVRRTRSRSAGRAMLGTEVCIFDESGKEVSSGVIGEIVARGPQVMKCYWEREKETSQTLKGGWLHTGDAGFMDDAGFVHITDRIKDMIISGGENVYSVEVEQAIYSIDGIAQCAVIGLPDEKWGERVHAIVVLKPGFEISGDTIREACAATLADYKRPRSISFRKEPLPLSGAGKVLKRTLKDELCGVTRND